MTKLQPAPADGTSKQQKKKKRKGPFKVQRYGGWLLYFWHGMRFGAWARLLAHGRFDITLNCLPNILTVSIWAPFNSALYYITEAIYRRRAEAISLDPPPVFILGHWRTGTTLLHDLMVCDPRYGAPSTYECVFPNHFLLTERPLAALFGVFLPKRRPQDTMPVGMERPQEEEFAYAILGMGTPYNTMAFPRHGPVDADYLDLEGLSDADRRKWVDGFLWFHKRLALKHGRPLVLKSPPHTARIKLLIELFPNAKFIHLARNPLAVVPSTVKLWRALYSTQGLHNPPRLDGWLEDNVLKTFERLASRYEADRNLIPKNQLVEITMETLAADPKGTLREIYRSLDLGPFEDISTQVDAYLAGREPHQPATYDTAEATRKKIISRLGPYIDRFGYRKAIEGADTTASP